MRTKAYPPLLVACAILSAPASAGASTLEIFSVSGTYAGGTLSGTFDYNGGVFSAFDITATGWLGTAAQSDVFNVDHGSTSTSIQVHSSSDALANLTLLPLVSLASISPGGSTTFGVSTTSNSGSTICQAQAGGHCNEFPVGSLRASVPATVPLPASLPLFVSGLGAMGLLRWLRKRLA
jgi:hypothetical protein